VEEVSGKPQVCHEPSCFAKEQGRVVAPPGLGCQGEELGSAASWAQWRGGKQRGAGARPSLMGKSRGRAGSSAQQGRDETLSGGTAAARSGDQDLELLQQHRCPAVR